MRDGVAGPLADITRGCGNTIKGTPGYMAPEQALPDHYKNDRKTDIYSLGALLYSILTLEKPVKGKNAKDIIAKTIKGDLLSPCDAYPQKKIPHGLNAIVCKAMERSPENRYQSVEELQHDVRAYTEGFATEAENASFHRLLLLMFKRHSAMMTLSLAGLIFISIMTYSFKEHLDESERVSKERIAVAKKNAHEEKIKRQDLSLKQANNLLEKSISLSEEGNYDDALKHINKALTHNPTLKKAWELKCILLCGMQEFTELISAAEKLQDYTNQYFLLIAEKYAPLINDNKLLPTEDFLSLIEELHSDRMLEEAGEYELFRSRVAGEIEKQLSTASFKKYPLHQRMIMLKDLLILTNPQQDELHITYVIDAQQQVTINLDNNPDLYTAKVLTGLPITELSLRHCGVTDLDFLRTMPLYKLDISGTAVHDLRALSQSTLEVLILTDTPVTDLSPILTRSITHLTLSSQKITPLDVVNHFSYLKELTIKIGLYSDEDIHNLESNIKVNVEP